MKSAVAFIVLVITLGIGVTEARAGRVDLQHAQCGRQVELIATDARLSEILKRLAVELDFELAFDAAHDPLVNTRVLQPAAQLISKLAPSQNVIVMEVHDARCPERRRIAKVWVLPNANGTATARATIVAPANALTPWNPMATTAAASTTTNVSGEDADRRARMMKLRKQLEDEYVKAHGTPPPSGDLGLGN